MDLLWQQYFQYTFVRKNRFHVLLQWSAWSRDKTDINLSQRGHLRTKSPSFSAKAPVVTKLWAKNQAGRILTSFIAIRVNIFWNSLGIAFFSNIYFRAFRPFDSKVCQQEVRIRGLYDSQLSSCLGSHGAWNKNETALHWYEFLHSRHHTADAPMVSMRWQNWIF